MAKRDRVIAPAPAPVPARSRSEATPVSPSETAKQSTDNRKRRQQEQEDDEDDDAETDDDDEDEVEEELARQRILDEHDTSDEEYPEDLGEGRPAGVDRATIRAARKAWERSRDIRRRGGGALSGDELDAEGEYDDDDGTFTAHFNRVEKERKQKKREGKAQRRRDREAEKEREKKQKEKEARPKKKSKKDNKANKQQQPAPVNQAVLATTQSSHLQLPQPPPPPQQQQAPPPSQQQQPSQPQGVSPIVYDHSHVPSPHLHPSLAGLVPPSHPHHHQQQHPAFPQPPLQPPQHQQQRLPEVPLHYQQAAAQISAQQQHRDIPVDPVLLGLLPTPPAHYPSSSIRSGGGGPAGQANAVANHQQQQQQLQQQQQQQEAVAAAVAGLARGGAQGAAAVQGPAAVEAVCSGGKASKKRKDKGKEKAKPPPAAGHNIQVASGGHAAAGGGGGEASTSQQQQQAYDNRFEPLDDLYGQVPDRKRHANNNADNAGGGRGGTGTIGAEGVEKAKGGFYEQLRSKWMSTKDLKQLSEQYGATYKQGKFSLAEDTTLRQAMEQFRLSRGMSPADLRRLLVTKRDVRKPLAHGQSQNEIWEYLAQAVGDRPLLSIYNHVKLLVAGDPIEAAGGSGANGTPQPDAAGASGSEATPGPSGTNANAVASGSGTTSAKPPSFTTVPGPSLEGVLGDANRKGRWSTEEDQQLGRLISELGSSWTEIGRQLGRSGVACRDRWTKQLNNGLALGLTANGESVPVQKAKEGKWTDEEVEQLKVLHAEHGSKWKVISTKMGGTRTSTQCRTKWNDYIARREAVGAAKGEREQQDSPAAEGAQEDGGAKADWRWHAADGSRLIHTVAALNVSDPTEIKWKEIDEPRLALHGAKNLRDRFRHLIKNAKLEIQREVGSIAEVSFADALAHLLNQHPTPDFDPTQAVSDAEKAQQRARRRAERKAAKKADREQRNGAANAQPGGALPLAHVGAAGLGGPAGVPPYMQHQQHQQPQQPLLAGQQFVGRTSNLSQAYVEDSDGEDEEEDVNARGDIRVDVMGRRI
ncbi:hypothetical protein JCM10908_002749 [Rhodotorula pacifica]|uniref:uncharacterized protein n=1 Tax=Rhodotorula pacifica TaxID=1495444 RepID=UPI003172E742